MAPRTAPPLLGAALALSFAFAIAVSGARAPAAAAIDPLKPICSVVGWVSGFVGKACGAVQHGDKLVSAGKKLITGHIGGAAKALMGGGAPSSAATGLATHAAALVSLAAVGAWVLGGAKNALHYTATVLDKSTRPQLTTTWFSSTYWRMAGIAALLTLPFLFAAAVQALIRSDMGMLTRAALGYLPLSLLAVSIAAPLTMLLLAASDEISKAVSSAAGGAGTRFLAQVGLVSGTLSALSRSPFIAFFVGLLTVSAAIVLWVEMLMREAAVYIVVLMLPLAFAAFVWPARRVWAIRAVELLIALILSKFAIVAVLALGGAALGQRGSGGVGGMLAGLVLVVLAAAAPWALVRLLPMTEVASAAAGQFRGEGWRMRAMHGGAASAASGAGDWAGSVTAGMRRQASDTPEISVHDDAPQSEMDKLRAAASGVASGGSGPAATRAASDALGGAAGTADGALVSAGAVAANGASTGPGTEMQTGVAAPGGEAGSSAHPPVKQRLPGLDGLYQQENGSWTPIELGPDAFSSEPLWDRPFPPGAEASEPERDGETRESGEQ